MLINYSRGVVSSKFITSDSGSSTLTPNVRFVTGTYVVCCNWK